MDDTQVDQHIEAQADTALPFKLPTATRAAGEDKKDPLRPEPVRGRYPLHDPETGKPKTWQRVTNFVKLTDDTYYLDLWKQRNIVKGLATMFGAPAEYGLRGNVAEALDRVAGMHVKEDKDALNSLASKAQDVADAYAMADEGTALHKSTELVDSSGGDLNRAPERHRFRVQMYLDALAVRGLAVVPNMIERLTVSSRFEVAGTFDRIYGLRDGSYVIGDLKTGDSLDLSFPSIAAQLDCYRDGINEGGVYAGKGERYDTSIQVRTDFGIVVHLPSTREEITVYAVDLSKGRIINQANLAVRDARKIKHQHVTLPFDLAGFVMTQDEQDQYWLDALNGAFTYDDLVKAARRAKCFNQWNDRLAAQARLLARELVSSPTGS